MEIHVWPFFRESAFPLLGDSMLDELQQHLDDEYIILQLGELQQLNEHLLQSDGLRVVVPRLNYVQQQHDEDLS